MRGNAEHLSNIFQASLLISIMSEDEHDYHKTCNVNWDFLRELFSRIASDDICLSR